MIRPRPDVRELAAIFAGGVIGALGRGGLEQVVVVHPDRWPWATFAVNIVGAGLLGLLATRLSERLPVSLYRHPLLATGLCGALTTFSTMMLELLRMIDAGALSLAVEYAAASIGGGLLAMFLATKLVRRAWVSA